jgi:hypothetical protein
VPKLPTGMCTAQRSRLSRWLPVLWIVWAIPNFSLGDASGMNDAKPYENVTGLGQPDDACHLVTLWVVIPGSTPEYEFLCVLKIEPT